MMRMKLAIMVLSIFHFADISGYSFNGSTSITPLTILEKTRKATYIIRVKLIEIDDATFEISVSVGNSQKIVKIKQYGNYQIIEIVKGKLKENTLRIDYKKINDAYKPGFVSSILRPEENEETILFLYKKFILVKGYQGKIRSDRTDLDEYMNAVKLSLSYDQLSKEEKLKKAVEYIINNTMLKMSMFKELHNFESVISIEQYAKMLNSDDYWVQVSGMQHLMNIEKINQGSVQEIIKFYDIIGLARVGAQSYNSHIAYYAMGELKIKKAIPFLEESLKSNNRATRKAAEWALVKIRE